MWIIYVALLFITSMEKIHRIWL